MITTSAGLSQDARSLMERSANADATVHAAGFRDVFTDDVEFTMGGRPTVSGVDAAVAAIDEFFQRMTAVTHDVHRAWQVDDTLIYEATVTWHLREGGELQADYTNHIDLEGDRAARYRIYIDTSVLRD